MKIIIEAEPKEIATLIADVRESQNGSAIETMLKELSVAFCRKNEVHP